jgi:hypothetical protein
MVAQKPKYPGIRITTNGNQLVASYTEARIADLKAKGRALFEEETPA